MSTNLDWLAVQRFEPCLLVRQAATFSDKKYQLTSTAFTTTNSTKISYVDWHPVCLARLVIRSRNRANKVSARCHKMVPEDVSWLVIQSRPFTLQPKSIFLATWLLVFALPQRTKADDRVEMSYEDYAENDGRIQVTTYGAYFESELASWFSVN